MGESLQHYFSNLFGNYSHHQGGIQIVSDNAKSPGIKSSINDSSLDWFIDCCAMDTAEPFCFSRWESVPDQNSSPKRDEALKRPPRRPSFSDNPVDEEDFAAIYLPKEDALPDMDEQPKRPIHLSIRAPPAIQRRA